MKNFVRYNGEHIYLSPIRADDEAVELYTKWVNDESINGWIGKSNCVYTLEDEQQWAQKNHGIKFNIVLKSDYTSDGLEKLIGNCGFTSVNNKSGTIGVLIGEEIGRDKGYGTEVIKLLIKFGFEELNLHRISLTLNSENNRAFRCYLKAGFKEYGRAHEELYFHGHYADRIYMEILEQDYFGK